MAEFLDKQMNIGIKLESAWDTAPSVSATLYNMIKAIPGTVIVNTNTNTANLNYTSSTGVYEETTRKLINNAGVIPSIEFECYATPEVSSILLELALHSTPGGSLEAHAPVNGVIDFPADEGTTGSLIMWSQAGDGITLKNAIVDSLTLSIDNVGSGEARLGRLSIRLVGTVMTTGQTITDSGILEDTEDIVNSGNIANDDFTLGLTVTGTAFTNADLCWRRYSLTISNNIISDCFDAHIPANFRRTNPSIEHTIDIPHNDTTVGFMTYFKDGEVVTFTLENGIVVSTRGYWLIQNGGDTYITQSPQAREGQMQSNSITLREMYDGTSWDAIVSLVTITF